MLTARHSRAGAAVRATTGRITGRAGAEASVMLGVGSVWWWRPMAVVLSLSTTTSSLDDPAGVTLPVNNFRRRHQRMGHKG